MMLDTNFITQLQAATDPSSPMPSPRVIPPLERWHPANCGDLPMQIKANGEWWHDGTKVTRQSLVDLFAKVLWAEVDSRQHVTYYLKTPVEKLRIEVEDAPLLVTQVAQISQQGKNYLQFTTSNGDVIMADEVHQLRLGLPFSNATSTSQYQPYLMVRQNGESILYGRLHRNVFFHLIDMGDLTQTNDDAVLTLQSGDTVYHLSMPMDSMDNK